MEIQFPPEIQGAEEFKAGPGDVAMVTFKVRAFPGADAVWNIIKITGNFHFLKMIVLTFFRKCDFFKSPNLQKKKYSKKLNLTFKIPAHNILLLLAGILNFKFRIVFWEIWRFEKRIALSERKPPLGIANVF